MYTATGRQYIHEGCILSEIKHTGDEVMSGKAAAPAPSAAAQASFAAAQAPSAAAHAPSVDVGTNIFSLRTSLYLIHVFVSDE